MPCAEKEEISISIAVGVDIFSGVVWQRFVARTVDITRYQWRRSAEDQ
jgi:hypothetical protein